jgi:predicted TIM-barrel fold metal-dependent hydrolase
MTLTIPTSDLRGMNIEEFDTTTYLAHASAQARERHLERMFIVDVDSHHYENASYRDIVEYIEDPTLRHRAKSTMTRKIGANNGLVGSGFGSQDMSGRITRYHTRDLEKVPGGTHRDITLSRRWMDAMGVDIAMLFPGPMLSLGSHPIAETEILWARAYNRWLVEQILPHEPRLRSMLYLPFNDHRACYQMVQDFGDKPGVSGFMVTSAHNQAVHHNDFMKTYAALEERDLPLMFHGVYNWEDSAFRMMNKFISVHALGFVFYNMLHLINWIMNGLPERFPKLKVIWMESGLAWIPFMMQRLDNEYAMRSNEAPALKMEPSDYMRRMYYGTQPMEAKNLRALELTFEMINAKTQLLWSSDYPHWDFDLPSVIYDLPFLDDEARRNILGETARKLFNLGNLGKLARIPPAP